MARGAWVVLAGTGKKGPGGEPLTVEADFIACTNPTNANSVFTAAIDLSEGYPKVTWDPDLNEDGTKMLRTYKVWGREVLDDGAAWVWPRNAIHRFCKVTVEMP